MNDFNNTNNNSGEFSNLLNDQPTLDGLALARYRGNNVATEGFGNDLFELNYGQLASKYGKQVADNRNNIQDGITNYQVQSTAERTPSQIIKDSALGAASGFTGLVGGLGSLGIAGLDATNEFIGGPDLNLDDAAVYVADQTTNVTNTLNNLQSQELQDRRKLQNIESQLDTNDLNTKYENSDQNLINTLSKAGEEFLNVGGRILSDPAITGDLVSQAVGSLGPSAKIAKIASNLAVKGTQRATTSITAERVARTLSTAAAVGLSEGSGVYQQTVNSVMSLSHEDLLETSDKYVNLINSGLSPNEAQTRLAVDTGNEAFTKQLPVATAIGLISSKFERNPVGVFDGSSIPDIARQIASQGTEEALQGGTGQLSQNIATQNQVNRNQDLSEGVADNLVTGLIGGVGVSGALSVPSTAGNIVGKTLEGAASTINNTRETVNKVNLPSPINKDNLDKITSNISKNITNTVSKIPTTKVSKISNKVLDKTKPISETITNSLSEKSGNIAKSVLSNGKIAFDIIKPVAQSTDKLVSKGSESVGNLIKKTNKLPDLKIIESTKIINDRLITPSLKGGIRVSKPLLPIIYQTAKISLKTSKPVVNQIKDISSSIVLDFSKPIIKSLRNISNTETQKEFKVANSNLNTFFNNIRNEYGNKTISDIPNYLSDLILVQNSDTVPKEFSDVASSDQSLLLNAVGVLNKISSSKNNYQNMSNEAIIYASSKIKELEILASENKEIRQDLNKTLFNPEIQKLNQLTKDIDLNRQDNSKVNIKDTNSNLLLAKTNPTNVSPQYINKLLNHSDRKDLSESDIKLLSSASKIAQAVNNHINEQVEISKETRVELSKKPAYVNSPNRLPPELNIDKVSRSIQVSGFTDARGKKLRSINDFASDIFKAGQSENNKIINEEGFEIDIQTLSNQMNKFVTHLSNKVDALNTSYDQNNKQGKGPSISFDSLVGGEKIIPAGSPRGAKPVSYHKSSPKSVEFAKKVHNDAVIAAQVYNTLIDTFPVISGSKKQINSLKEDRNNSQIVEEETQSQIAASDEQSTNEKTNEENTENQEQEDINNLINNDRGFSKLPKRFHDSFFDKNSDIDYKNGKDLLDIISKNTQSKEYIKFAKILLDPLMNKVNNRINTVKLSKKDPRTVAEVLQSDDIDITKIRDFKNLLFVNPNNQKYNNDLLSIATLTVIDWLSSVRPSNPNRLNDSLEDLGLDYSDLKDNDIENISYGISPRQIVEPLAKRVLDNWDLEINPDASMVDSRGSVESLVKELITVIADTGLVKITDIPINDNGKLKTTQTINVKPLKDIQDKIGLSGQNSLQRLLNPEDIINPSIGELIPETDQTQNRGNTPLSKIEKAALKKIQDTPHYISNDITNLVEAIGFDSIAKLLGYTDLNNFDGNNTLLRSIEGKNLSIERDFEDAFKVIKDIKNYAEDVNNVPVYYPVSISKVGRHQFKGINPQNNKILRALVTPTHTTLDMNNKEDQDAFWLTIAQSSELYKVENQNHNHILSNIQNKFNEKYSDAVNLVTGFLKTKKINSVDLLNTLPSNIEVSELNSIIAVSQLRLATEQDTLSEFKTSLSFELDGKTDGPGNMMSNFGQGLLTQQDMNNFNRVGFFLGEKDKTLNDYFSSGNVDLYEITSQQSERNMFNRISNTSISDKNLMYASARFASKFGDFEINDSGQISMTRSTSKNPMTKTVYGSGIRGIAEGIEKDMVLNFYRDLSSIPEGQDIEKYLGYPNLIKDIKLLFNIDLGNNINTNSFEFSKNSIKYFQDIITKGIGEILSTTSKEVIGEPIKNVNDTLIFITNIQTQFLQKLFDNKINELVEKRKQEGVINSKRDLSQRDYDRIVKELSVYAPVYSNGVQQLNLGSFSPQTSSDVELSSNMDGKLRQKSSLRRPDIAGVKVIPYLSIGRGDAMMMNTIYSENDAPSDTLPIFDGIDMPINKITTYASQINKAVLKNWDRDILKDVVQDFESFLTHVGSNKELLNQTFQEVKSKNKDITVTSNNVTELLDTLKEQQQKNQARKTVFKQIPLSVDHMGGSSTSYSRGSDESVNLQEINQLIQKELDRKNNDKLKPNEPFEELNISNVDIAISNLLKKSKNRSLIQTVRSIKNNIPNDLKIITGSIDQLNNYRINNFPNDGQIINGAGTLDTTNNVIFLVKDSEETLVHELIHASTFNKVLDYYQGDNTNSQAIERLESLMFEFMGLDFSNSNKVTLEAVNASKEAILSFQSKNDSFSKAGALNEFMAWTLSNEQLIKKLKNTRTKLIETLSKKVINLMKRLLGNVPNDIFSNILFNTRIIANSSDNGNNNNNGNDNNDNDNITPPINNFTNFWIDLVKQKLEDAKESLTPLTDAKRLTKYVDNSKDAIYKLESNGFSFNEYEKQTFKAIHTVLATEMKLDTQSALALGNVYNYVTDNLSPEMFNSNESQRQYSTVMDLFGASSNEEGVSDSIAVLLALSQTSKLFRNALDQLPEPESQSINSGSLNEFLTTSTGFLLRKVVGSIDTSDASVKTTIDNLSENLIRQDSDKEFSALRSLMKSVDKADNFTSNLMSELAERTDKLNIEVENSNASTLKKLIVSSVSLATSFLDEQRGDIAVQGIKDVTHMGTLLDKFVPVREFVTEIAGTDNINSDTVALLDKTNYSVSSVRQAYREELPVILQNQFTKHPNEDEWKMLHNVLGKTDFSKLFNINKPKQSMRLISQPGFLNKKINDTENAIKSNFSKTVANDILDKSKQLADYMNGNGAGHQLIKNAYAINKLAGAFDATMTDDIDNLISMYAIQNIDNDTKQSIIDIYDRDSKAIKGVMTYIQGLNKEEDLKIVSEVAKMNGYKGYIPDHPTEGYRLIIEDDSKETSLEKLGFTRIGDYLGEEGFSSTSRGYYFTSIKQGGSYTQGVLQSVQDSYKGVDASTGLTITGNVSGIISAESANFITDKMNKITSIPNDKEALIPVYDDEGVVLHYERAINPDLFNNIMQPKSNLALMLGSWAGRQVEEKFSEKYNNELIDQLKTIYDNRNTGSDNLFINIADDNLSDEVFKDTWRVIPPKTKNYISDVFGEDSFYVRKDMINLALGYRDPSILDVWTGKTRLPDNVQKTIKTVSKLFLGDHAFKLLSIGEEGIQNVVSNAKDLIIVRSIVIPYMNIQANVMQLATRGVGTKDLIKGSREKLAEIERYNENVNRLIQLDADIKLSANDKNRVAILEGQMQTILDENKRMTISPLIEAGAYKNISEGITDLDVELTSGRMGEWIEKQLNKLPRGAQTIAKYGLMSKDTSLYKGANKAVQYGDFIAKSILYDHYINRENMDKDIAIKRINEEFVNFSVLPGRTRTYLESLGATWFLTFKVRIMKIALGVIRDNPVRALITANTVGDLGSPVNDNLVSVIAQDRLDYSLGWDMLFGSPSLNPWVQLSNWNE